MKFGLVSNLRKFSAIIHQYSVTSSAAAYLFLKTKYLQIRSLLFNVFNIKLINYQILQILRKSKKKVVRIS